MIFVKFYPSQVKALFNTIIIMFFSGFPTLSYPIQPNATTSIGYTKPYGNSSQSNLLSSYLQIIIPYESNTLLIKKLSLQELLFLQSKTTWSTNALFLIQSMLNSLRNGRCSFTFRTLLVNTTSPTISNRKPLLYFSQL